MLKKLKKWLLLSFVIYLYAECFGTSITAYFLIENINQRTIKHWFKIKDLPSAVATLPPL
jgi:hypothetical protein